MASTRSKIILTTLLIFYSLTASVSAQSHQVGLAWVGPSKVAPKILKGFKEILGGYYAGIGLEIKEGVREDELKKILQDWNESKDAIVLLDDEAVKILESTTITPQTFIATRFLKFPPLTKTKINKPIGVSGLPTAGYQFDIFEAIIENIEKVVLIVSKDAPLSSFDISMAQSLTKGRGIELEIQQVKDFEEAKKIAEKAEGDSVDAILLGSDEDLIKKAKSLVEAAGKVPVISFYCEGVKKGVAIGFRPDYFKLGMSLGRQVLEHLLTGLKDKDFPLTLDKNPSVIINPDTLDKLNIHVPFEIMEQADLEH